MNIFDQLITDRTREDVELVKSLCKRGYDNLSTGEKALLDGPLKGAYDYRDMNRLVGVMEYLHGLLAAAGTVSGYEPVVIQHRRPSGFTGDGAVAGWDQWEDTVWIDYDLLRPALWAAHLANVRQFWAHTRKISAVVLPRYDPEGRGYVKPGRTVALGDFCTITECVGLAELSVAITCDPARFHIQGSGWACTWTGTGCVARYAYPGGPFTEIENLLSALTIECTGDGVFDMAAEVSATLRHGTAQKLGRCAILWSSVVYWRDLKAGWASWGELQGRGLSWHDASRGGGLDD